MLPLMLASLIALLISAVVPSISRWALTGMPPGKAVALCAFASVAAALAVGATISSLAVASLSGWPPIAHAENVSVDLLRRLVPIPTWFGMGAGVVVLALFARAAVTALRIGVALRAAHRASRELPGTDSMVFIDDIDIFTIAGLRGRVVVGTRLYDQLDDGDRRVVTAHEQSHLRRRHHLYLHAVDIASAANPILRSTRDTIRLGIERWADEDAAAAVADRSLTAHALARVALKRQSMHRVVATSGALVLGAATHQVSTRVKALLEPAPRRRSSQAAALALACAGLLVLAATSLLHADGLVDAATYPFRSH